MARTIIIAPYGYKGTMEAFEAAGMMASVVAGLGRDLAPVELPLGDGGRGTTRAIVRARGGRYVKLAAHDALGDLRECMVGVMGNEGIMEAASVVALADVPVRRRHPELLCTRGIGELLLGLASLGCRSMSIGLGDTATHDCGIGMASALGYRFVDASGAPLEPVGASLGRIARIEGTLDPSMRGIVITALCDVLNPLAGPDGAALLFAGQKGASPETARELEAGGRALDDLVRRDLARPLDAGPGSGAAGGLGGGLAAFLGATLIGGADAVLDAVDMDGHLRGASLVITGEGSVDRKTLLGKGAAKVAARARRAGVPCLIVAGRVEGAVEEFERRLGVTIVELGREHRDDSSGSASALAMLRERLRAELPAVIDAI